MRRMVFPWGALPLGGMTLGGCRARPGMSSRRDGGFCFIGAPKAGAQGTA